MLAVPRQQVFYTVDSGNGKTPWARSHFGRNCSTALAASPLTAGSGSSSRFCMGFVTRAFLSPILVKDWIVSRLSGERRLPTCSRPVCVVNYPACRPVPRPSTMGPRRAHERSTTPRTHHVPYSVGHCRLCTTIVQLSFFLREFRDAVVLKLRQLSNQPPLGSTEGTAPSAFAFASTSNSGGERPMRRRRRRGSPALCCWKTHLRRSTRAIRFASDPATHRLEQSRQRVSCGSRVFLGTCSSDG